MRLCHFSAEAVYRSAPKDTAHYKILCYFNSRFYKSGDNYRTACSLNVSISLAGKTVEIAYDPMMTDTITVSCEGTAPVTARPLAIPEYCDKTPVRPSCLQEDKPETSRFLDSLKKQAE